MEHRRALLRSKWLIARIALFVALGWFYVAAATEHARTVNTSKARGDQSGYLWDAQRIYANWEGASPLKLVGERMRMPLYPAYLALFWDRSLSDADFFQVAIVWSIRLSVVLLALFAVIVSWHLPPLVSMNLMLIVAFGYFVFKAGYSQPELLFYFLFFITFLACWHLMRRAGSSASVLLGAAAGTLGGLAHLTKATVPAFIGVFVAIYGGREIVHLSSSWHRRELTRDTLVRVGWRAAAAGTMVSCFLCVVYPYIATSRRVFGDYFFNHNTNYYMWYDDGGTARAEMLPLTDDEGRLAMPESARPGLAKYWRSHTLGQIARRLVDGLTDTAVRSYRTYWFYTYLLLYVAYAALLIAGNWHAFIDLVRQRTALAIFLASYGTVFLLSIAFFVPTSSTGGTRFFLAHLAPLFFVLSSFFVRAPFSERKWTIGGVTVTPAHFHLLVASIIAFDLTFTIWPRLMSTYGGF
jgi:hypothetical protein